MLTMGFYCGLAISFPYQPVYCPNENCLGDCRGVYIYSALSAPLPEHEKTCTMHDFDSRRRYEWSPKVDRHGWRICFVSDRGKGEAE